MLSISSPLPDSCSNHRLFCFLMHGIYFTLLSYYFYCFLLILQSATERLYRFQRLIKKKKHEDTHKKTLYFCEVHEIPLWFKWFLKFVSLKWWPPMSMLFWNLPCSPLNYILWNHIDFLKLLLPLNLLQLLVSVDILVNWGASTEKNYTGLNLGNVGWGWGT